MIEQRVERAAGRALRSLEPVKTRGYARAFHAIATFEDDSTAFVKAGAEAVTSAFLRDELRSYLSIQGPFMPGLLGYDEKDPPLLVLEDLSLGRWPPGVGSSGDRRRPRRPEGDLGDRPSQVGTADHGRPGGARGRVG